MRTLALVLLLTSVAACKKSERPVDRYTTRGKVAAIDPKGALDIHHERIADYKTRDGAAKGMDSMVMTFTPVAGTKVDPGIVAGDPVTFSFEVHWDEAPYLRLTAIEELPADTTLELK